MTPQPAGAGCYNAPLGTPTFNGPAERVIARIYPNGTVDTTLSYPHLFPNPNLFQSVVSLDGQSSFWVGGSPYQTTAASSPSPSVLGGMAATAGVFYLDGPPSGTAPGVPVYNAFLPLASLALTNITGTPNLLVTVRGTRVALYVNDDSILSLYPCRRRTRAAAATRSTRLAT